MLWLLLGCAAHRASLPVDTIHSGPDAHPPILPLRVVAIEAVDPSCVAIAEALTYAWTTHAGQLTRPDAEIALRVQNCGVDLTERIQSLAADPAQLDALLTGRGWATVFIERDDEVLDVIRAETLRIEQEDWEVGGTYPWRDGLAAAVSWGLVEELEAELLPLAILRAPRNVPKTTVIVEAIPEDAERSAPLPVQGEPLAAGEDPPGL